MSKIREALEAARRNMRRLIDGESDESDVAAALAKIDAALREMDEEKPVAIKGKPLEWEDGQPNDWRDRYHGFWINFEHDDNPEYRYTAGWGEGDVSHFPSLAEARAWCQSEFDAWIGKYAVLATPLTQDAEDAARYRWLRVRINSLQSWPAEKALDAMIDAAINAKFDAARGSEHGR